VLSNTGPGGGGAAAAAGVEGGSSSSALLPAADVAHITGFVPQFDLLHESLTVSSYKGGSLHCLQHAAAFENLARKANTAECCLCCSLCALCHLAVMYSDVQ
jgi:hypothetical protein